MTEAFVDSFPSPDEFFEDIEKINEGKLSAHDVVYQLSYKSGSAPTVLSGQGNIDTTLFTSDQLTYLKERYTRLRDNLKALVDNGWTIKALDITSNKGHTGVVLKVTNPRGSPSEYRYMRGDDITNLIPDDLLTDTEKLHERYMRFQ